VWLLGLWLSFPPPLRTIALFHCSILTDRSVGTTSKSKRSAGREGKRCWVEHPQFFFLLSSSPPARLTEPGSTCSCPGLHSEEPWDRGPRLCRPSLSYCCKSSSAPAWPLLNSTRYLTLFRHQIGLTFTSKTT
jgi:hypothetical protein